MIKSIVSSLCIISCLLTYSFAFQNSDQKFKIAGPFTHKNLAVFLIHGKNKIAVDNLLTLQEAIEQKKIIIHETENVNELHVENVSNINIFIQSGDIVKGGKQDRIFQYDLVVKPKSGRIPIASFCVEQQRWSKRGEEDLGQFNSSNKRVSSKDLKIAAKHAESQSEVWEEVTVVQDKLSGVAGKSVNSPQSASSLQLTLENKDIARLTKEYVDNISDKIDITENAIGYIFAINGEINSADIYANSKLFKKMWPKLLDASSTEAISELNESQKFAELTTTQVLKWLNEAELGDESKRSVNDDVDIKIKDSEENVLYETYTKDDKRNWIHKNIIKK